MSESTSAMPIPPQNVRTATLRWLATELDATGEGLPGEGKNVNKEKTESPPQTTEVAAASLKSVSGTALNPSQVEAPPEEDDDLNCKKEEKNVFRWIRYEVKPFETLEVIAMRFNCKKSIIKRLNPGIAISGTEWLHTHYPIVLLPAENNPQEMDSETQIEFIDVKNKAVDPAAARCIRIGAISSTYSISREEAQLYLEASGGHLKSALQKCAADEAWENEQREVYQNKTRLSPAKHSSAAVCPLIKDTNADPHEKFVEENITRHFEEQDMSNSFSLLSALRSFFGDCRF